MSGDPMRLDGKVAVVTGAAQGIGRGIAEVLAAAGAQVLVGDLRDARATVEAIRQAGGVADQLTMDTTERETVELLMDTAVRRFGSLDVLVNNAAIDAPAGDAATLPIAEWQRTLDVNLTGVFHCSQAAIARMPAAGGCIVNICSDSSWLGEEGLSPAYNASKSGLIGLTMAFATQLAERGIRVNAVAPGEIRSRDFGWTPAESEAHERLYALGLGTPEDVAYLVRYLASPAARWVTGSLMYIHGGFRGGSVPSGCATS
ncbi:MAG: SDR family oxidoreductase [Actinobacteria bacterium]|nr:SDR family oxidoreductase [Actinomycetota bacterium]